MNLRSDGNTTVRAGRLMPAAMVSVDTTNLISRSSASCSTSCLVARQDAGVVDADAVREQRLQLLGRRRSGSSASSQSASTRASPRRW
jgi:hypothetical protein